MTQGESQRGRDRGDGCSHHCGRFIDAPVTRREMLRTCASGFGGVALSALLAGEARGSMLSGGPVHSTLTPRFPHHTPRVRHIIFLYMDGGPSQVDTWDPKERLTKEHGKPFAMKMEPTQFDNNGTTFKSPWDFHRHGESGTPVSDLFPHIAKSVDDLVVIRSMVSEFSEHTNANYFLHTGLGLSGRPSMGAWVSYGLGIDEIWLPPTEAERIRSLVSHRGPRCSS